MSDVEGGRHRPEYVRVSHPDEATSTWQRAAADTDREVNPVFWWLLAAGLIVVVTAVIVLGAAQLGHAAARASEPASGVALIGWLFTRAKPTMPWPPPGPWPRPHPRPAPGAVPPWEGMYGAPVVPGRDGARRARPGEPGHLERLYDRVPPGAWPLEDRA